MTKCPLRNSPSTDNIKNHQQCNNLQTNLSIQPSHKVSPVQPFPNISVASFCSYPTESKGDHQTPDAVSIFILHEMSKIMSIKTIKANLCSKQKQIYKTQRPVILAVVVVVVRVTSIHNFSATSAFQVSCNQ